ncbi:hypothetical protein CUJ83_06045 [Methanocella sp. CWC-04]|uniref:Uncharacterized protein n=1 Tax=Methanooceanicella nereidis TaxID=2052831 RepID=A0AAP2RCG4_9EURY|nr:hypothetical protein [Methanocella sp. CWC-04]MCD1294562.1 hypothetical protein [Methanocella sp. CWC-04]
MRLKVLFAIILIIAVLTMGFIFPRGAIYYEEKANVVLKVIGNTHTIKPSGEFVIPEKPLQKSARVVTMYSDDPEIEKYRSYSLIINYYTAPEPPGFTENFLDDFVRGAIVGVDEYRLEGNNITVFIGNTPDWKDQIRLIRDQDMPTKEIKLFKISFDLLDTGVYSPDISGFKKYPFEYNNNPFSRIGNNRDFEGYPNFPEQGSVFKWTSNDSASELGLRGVANYLGFSYEPFNAALLCEGELYYTGQSFDGKKIYVSALCSENKERVPDIIFLKNDDGSYSAYKLSDRPPVYAYTLYGAYNTNESVGFGVYNDRGGKIELKNAAPWEIQFMKDGSWKTIFSPIAAQVITPLAEGSFKEWSWDQKLDDGSMAPFGEYRVVVDNRFMTNFRISPDVPLVDHEDTNYDSEAADGVFMDPAVQKAFGNAYTTSSYNDGLKDEMISQMQYKAWAKGLDPKKLISCINATGIYDDNTKALPSEAVYAKYNGKPVWIIVFNWGMGDESLSHIKYFIVDEAMENVEHSNGCR